MKFYINKKDLYNSLKICNSLVDNSTSNPYIQCIYIEANKNKLTFITTNGLISCKSEIENVNIISEGKILVKSKLLFNIIQKFKNEEFFFEKVDNSILNIRTDFFDSNITIIEDEKYPNINFDYNNWKEITFPNLIFKNIFSKIIHSVSQNKEKPSVLNGVLLESKNGILSIAATDSYKLSYLSYEYKGEEFKIILDSSLFLFLSNIFDVKEDIKMYISNNNFILKINNFLFAAKLIEGDYPNVINIIKSPRENFTIINRKELIEALERGMILTMVDKKPIVKINFNENSMILNFKSTNTDLYNSSKEIINISSFYGIEMTFLLNANFLLNLLKVVDNDLVKISNSKENKPLIITDDKNENFIQLLLPLRNI